MKIELETQDLDTIAERVIEALRPYLSRKDDGRDNAVLDVPGLCDYLKVTAKWVYEQTHLKTIPHIKLSGKVLRFKKRDIEKWLETMRTPAVGEPTGKFRLLK